MYSLSPRPGQDSSAALRASRWCMAPVVGSTRQLVATIDGVA